MSINFNQLEKQVNSILAKLPQETDRSWLVAAYLSLKKAHGLDYKYDAISQLSKNDQEKVLSKVTSLDFDNFSNLSENERIWSAGYFFNNAMFRIVALAEICLKVLFEKQMNMEAPDKAYGWLSEWYKKTFSHKLTNIQKARKRVNKFKHEPRAKKKKEKFEKMREGIDAFRELLTLLEHIVDG